MTWPWHGTATHAAGEFAKSRARAELESKSMRDRAVRTVADQAVDDDDFRRLLSMLGLEGESGGAPGKRGGGMNQETESTSTLERGLSGYVRMVAAELGVPDEATGFEISDTVTAYVGLAQRWPLRPNRDLMLVWTEQHGWFVAVETGPVELPVVLGYLGGDDVTPEPHSVAWFVSQVIADRHPARPRPVFPTGRDLATRLHRYRQNVGLR